MHTPAFMTRPVQGIRGRGLLRKAWRHVRCLTLGLATAWGPVWAHDEGEPPAPTLKPVQITGNYDNAVGSFDAASQGAVGADLIRLRPVAQPGEVLEFVPGLIVTQHSGSGKANQFFLRGFNLDHGTDFATWVDGVPVNMPTHAHGQGYTDLNFLIPELVQRIDYRKGPYAAEDGDFSSAGSARLQLVNVLPQGLAQLTAGHGGYRRTLLADTVDAGPGHLLWGLELGRQDGPWTEPERLHKRNALLRYSLKTAALDMSLTAMHYRARWNATDQVPLRAVQDGRLGRFDAVDPSDGGNTGRDSLSLRWRQRNLGGRGVVEADAWWLASRLDLFSNFTYALDNPVDGDQFRQAERRRAAGLLLAQGVQARWGGVDTQTRVGLQLRQDRLAPVGLYASTARLTTGVVREDTVRQTSLGLFLENTAQWHEKFRSVLGLRHDQQRFEVTSNLPVNSGRQRASLVSPKLALVAGPWARTEFFVNWGEGFHSNDARGTTAVLSARSGDPLTPVPPLVKSRGYELGLRTEPLPDLQSSLALWVLRLGSELVFVGDAGDTEASRPSRRHGLEWNTHWRANRWLSLDADLSLSRARFTTDDGSGTAVPGAIERVLALGVTVSEWRGWSGGLTLRYFGPRPLTEDNRVRSSGSTLVNGRIGYRWDAATQLGLDVFNLFNRRASDIEYFYASRLRGEASAVDDIHFHPVAPRSLRVNLVHRF